MKASEHFLIQELVSESLYRKFGNKCIWWIQKTELVKLEWFRSLMKLRFGADVYVIINNWHSGGGYQYSGIRDSSCKIGSEDGFHNYALGWDVKVYYGTGKQVDSDLVYDTLMYNEKECLKIGITTLEDKSYTSASNPKNRTGWTHIDSRNTGLDKLKIVKP